MPRSKSGSVTSGSNERLEPKLLQAVEADNLEELKRVIETATSNGLLSPNFLKIIVFCTCTALWGLDLWSWMYVQIED